MTDDAHQQVADLLFGHWASRALRVVADLSIADHLARGPLTAEQVSERECSDPEFTYRLMRAGVGLGLLTVDSAGRFASTPMLETLRTDHPRSLRPHVMTVTSPTRGEPWHRCSGVVRSGRRQAGTGSVGDVTALWAGPDGPAIDTSRVKLAVDVGAANPTFLRSLQEADPDLHGIVFDRPAVCADIAAEMARSDFADRTEVVGGDFFDSVPAADLYLLKFVLHEWDDADCVTILRRCREAMLPGGRVAIIEMLVGDVDDPGIGAFADLDMLALAHAGRERSLAEFDALLAAAGLRRTAVLTTGSPQRVIEAVTL